MTGKRFILVSGLPASGKTTLARALAAKLNLPFFDKDDILEALFETVATVDPATRQRLSRESDAILAKHAEASDGAVIVSFWRHEAAGGTSGTPTGWLTNLSSNIVELYCDCPPAVAEARFRTRQRHPGHNDASRADQLRDQFERLAALGPLGVGRLIRVQTDDAYDLDVIAADIRGR